MRPRVRDREQGASLVEFALVLPLLAVLLFGILEFGMALNDYQSIRQGTREGARQAAVQQYGSTPSTCGDSSWPSEVRQTVCLTESRIGLGSGVAVAVVFTNISASENSVRVCTQRNVDPVTGLIPAIDNVILKTSIEMRMEKPVPASVTPGNLYQETAGDWSWC